MVSKALNVGLRVWEFICSIIIMGLVGNMIATAFKGNSAMVNYDMFAATFGLASLLYLLPTSFLENYSMPILNIGLDALNVIFWFCSAVATAAYLHVHSCNNRNYTLHNHITNSSHNTEKRCREAQASTAFFWFGWAAFVGSLVISLLSGRSSGANLRGGIRRGGPAMSQVQEPWWWGSVQSWERSWNTRTEAESKVGYCDDGGKAEADGGAAYH